MDKQTAMMKMSPVTDQLADLLPPLLPGRHNVWLLPQVDTLSPLVVGCPLLV